MAQHQRFSMLIAQSGIQPSTKMSSAGSRRVYKALLKERLVASVSDTCIKLNVSAVPFKYGEQFLALTIYSTTYLSFGCSLPEFLVLPYVLINLHISVEISNP